LEAALHAKEFDLDWERLIKLNEAEAVEALAQHAHKHSIFLETSVRSLHDYSKLTDTERATMNSRKLCSESNIAFIKELLSRLTAALESPFADLVEFDQLRVESALEHARNRVDVYGFSTEEGLAEGVQTAIQTMVLKNFEMKFQTKLNITEQIQQELILLGSDLKFTKLINGFSESQSMAHLAEHYAKYQLEQAMLDKLPSNDRLREERKSKVDSIVRLTQSILSCIVVGEDKSYDDLSPSERNAIEHVIGNIMDDARKLAAIADAEQARAVNADQAPKFVCEMPDIDSSALSSAQRISVTVEAGIRARIALELNLSNEELLSLSNSTLVAKLRKSLGTDAKGLKYMDVISSQDLQKLWLFQSRRNCIGYLN